MTEQRDDGGPAFPNTGNSTWNLQPATGMALRDWLAGQAMNGLVSGILASGKPLPTDPEKVARAVYDMADAMLEVRKCTCKAEGRS